MPVKLCIRISRYLWMMFCLIGNIIQLHWMSSQYFNYDISTNVQLFIPDEIDSPSVTICIELWRMIRWSSLSVDERKSLLQDSLNLDDPQVQSFDGRILESLVRNASVAESFAFLGNIQKLNISDIFRITLDWRDLVNVVGAYNSKERKVSLDNAFLSIKEYLRDDRKCYQLELKNDFGRNLSFYGIRRTNLFRGHLAVFHFSERYVHLLNNGLYGLNTIGEVYNSIYMSYLYLQIDEGITYMLTFNEYHNSLLLPPYATRCRDYSTERLKTRAGCYESCLRSLSLKRWDRLHPFVALFPNETHQVMTFSEIYEREDDYENMNEVCSVECRRRDCLNVLFVPRQFTHPLKFEEISSVHQIVSLSPVTKTDTIEQLSLIQFLTDVASSMGFWFGLSAFRVIQMLINGIERLSGRTLIRAQDDRRNLNYLSRELYLCRIRCDENAKQISDLVRQLRSRVLNNPRT